MSPTDTERLDWLERFDEDEVSRWQIHPVPEGILLHNGNLRGEASLREAIDKAIAVTEETA